MPFSLVLEQHFLEGKNHDDCLHIASMDIVWLKRDVRLQDHGPFSVVANSKRPFLILYMYEPDQLSQPSVHGSHLKFIHEGLVDLDNRLSKSNSNDQSCKEFQCLTICHNTAVETFQTIPIHILEHQLKLSTKIPSPNRTKHVKHVENCS